MEKEKTTMGYAVQIWKGSAFALFFFGLMALTLVPDSWEIRWDYIILGAIGIALFFAVKKNKTLRIWLICGGIIFLLWRSGKLEQLIGLAVIIFLIWLGYQVFSGKKKT